MPFGLWNRVQSFQRFIHQLCRGLHFVFAYVDVIPVASTSAAQHEQNLRLIFERLMSNGLVVNASKCVCGASELEFL